MKNRISMLLSLTVGLCLGACKTPGDSKQVADLTCLPKAELDKHQGWLETISNDYCDHLYLNLAPPKPEGVEEHIKVLNPEPKLPNYAEYPDVHPTSAGASRTSKIARFMYKKCKALGETPTLACRGVEATDCADPFFTFMLDRLAEVGKTTKAPPYIMHHVVKDAGAQYTKLTQKEPQLCEGGGGLGAASGLAKNPAFNLSLGLAVDACASDDHCPGETKCSYVAAGRRCLPEPTAKAAAENLEPLDPGSEEATIAAADAKLPSFEPKTLGQNCITSRECTGGTWCAGVLGNAPVCATPCTESSQCGEGAVCYGAEQGGGACVPGCKEGALCAETAQGKVLVNLRKADYKRRTGEAAPSGGVTEAALQAAMPKLAKAGACGNGVIDYPEACDAGADNGKPAFGGWCSKDCQRVECGDGIIDPGEKCECSIAFSEEFYTKDKFQADFRSEAFCPGRFAVTDGSEVATGFTCLSCEILYLRIPKVDTRTGDDYMPREIPGTFKAADGTPGFIWNSKKRKELWEKQQKEQEVRGMVEDLVAP